MAALNGGLGSSGLSNGTGSTMEALTQAYSGIQQYAAAALPTLYNQNLLTQQSIGAAGSQKEGEFWEARAQGVAVISSPELGARERLATFGGAHVENRLRSPGKCNVFTVRYWPSCGCHY